MFDWQNFLTANGIDFSEHGPSTAKGNLYIHCPFCGSADHGRHMGVSLHGRGWGCWRESSHRGRNPTKLVQALLGCSWQDAQRITGSRQALPTSGISDRVRAALGFAKAEQEEKRLGFPKEFRKLRLVKPLPHMRYLRERGFSVKEIDLLARRFRLRSVWVGSRFWTMRLIIPVYDMDGALVTWTGRGVAGQSLRYRSHSPDPEKIQQGEEPALRPITDCLLNTSQVRDGGKFLVISEGPFDCMKLSLFTKDYDAVPTCLFGKAISSAQVSALSEVGKYYDKIFLLLDRDARLSSLRMTSHLRALNVSHFPLPGKKDPGDMSAGEIRLMLEQMANQVTGTRH